MILGGFLVLLITSGRRNEYSTEELHNLQLFPNCVSKLRDRLKSRKVAQIEVSRHSILVINSKNKLVSYVGYFLTFCSKCPPFALTQRCQRTSSLINSSVNNVLLQIFADSCQTHCRSLSVFWIRSCYEVINQLRSLSKQIVEYLFLFPVVEEV